MKLSYATAVKLGLKNGKINFEMPTAYIMIGEKCIYNCAFCSQAREATTPKDHLSRVTWPTFELSQIKEKLKNNSFKRICLQVVSSKGYEIELKEALEFFKDIKIPISISIRPKNIEEVKELFNKYNVDKVGISIDAVNENLFNKIRNGNYQRQMSILRDCANIFLHKITTHVIVGLGETDKDIVKFMLEMKRLNVTTSLFAFTPIQGTPLENLSRPSLERYRSIQYVREIINNYEVDITKFDFNPDDSLKSMPNLYIDKEEAKKTSGCPWCTRPYYNDTPKKVYNIPEVRKI
ncbi:radical SAM protein [Tepiditoga spiralis]|uniref:Radical SAM protein n=1 Tax=Tepiditoga spiralis TaxID=2108365 RepID=A0A7G1GBB3_9BACT|nr:radical SAM protein [Tepiditoga spiralis]BBE31652.1 radical SAM protein [Tepiditoga spiralis]